MYQIFKYLITNTHKGLEIHGIIHGIVSCTFLPFFFFSFEIIYLTSVALYNLGIFIRDNPFITFVPQRIMIKIATSSMKLSVST